MSPQERRRGKQRPSQAGAPSPITAPAAPKPAGAIREWGGPGRRGAARGRARMAEAIADWQRADSAHLDTYRGVMRLFLWGTVAAVALLAVMALFLL